MSLDDVPECPYLSLKKVAMATMSNEREESKVKSSPIYFKVGNAK